jgi:hypothetical protein
MAPPFQCYAKINEKILPIRRGEVYETPLTTALERSGLGTVEGGGTMQNKNKEIEYVGIDVVLQNKEEGVSFVCQFLEERGAPKGSVFQIGAEHFPFGKVEAVAVYFDGVNLPSEVYHDCDINFVWSEFEKRIGANGPLPLWGFGIRHASPNRRFPSSVSSMQRCTDCHICPTGDNTSPPTCAVLAAVPACSRSAGSSSMTRRTLWLLFRAKEKF